MVKSFRLKKPLYPLIALLSNLLVFITGLLTIDQAYFIYFLLAFAFILACFGHAKTILRVMPVFILIGILAVFMILIYAPLNKAIQWFFRIQLIALCVVPTISISPIDLVRNFNQLKIPRWLTLGQLIALRFMPILVNEIKTIRRAMKLRGLNVSWYNPKTWYRTLIIPLVSRILTISQTMSTSLETRAFSMEGESSQYKTVDVKFRDIVYILLVIILCICAIGMRGNIL